MLLDSTWVHFLYESYRQKVKLKISKKEILIINRIQAFQQKVDSLRQKLKIPGLSVAILKGQQVMFANGFGYANIKKKTPATKNTPYHMASLTKPFAAVVLMKLVDEGKLDLEDEMADILKDTPFPFSGSTVHGYDNVCEKIREIGKDTSLPFAELIQDYRFDNEKITVRHHLTHTSQGVPGEAYRYNGFLYGMLSLIAEEVSGKSFSELLVDNIIRPVKMTRTVPNISDRHRDAVLADLTKYYKITNAGKFVISQWPSKEVIMAFKEKGLKISERLNAGSGMISTALDLAKFDVAMDRDLIISKESKEAMFTPTISNSGQPLPYGIGDLRLSGIMATHQMPIHP
jgi:CubicO group peptidase (beta-lactamase class C family)